MSTLNYVAHVRSSPYFDTGTGNPLTPDYEDPIGFVKNENYVNSLYLGPRLS